MGLVFIFFQQSNGVFIAHRDDYTLEQCIMGNTYILVCSLPANWEEDHVLGGGREGWVAQKGREKEENELTAYKSGETLTQVSSLSNMWERQGPKDQRSEDVLWRSLISVLTRDEKKNLLGGTEWVKHSQQLFWCAWSPLLRCPNCFSRAAQRAKNGEKMV